MKIYKSKGKNYEIKGHIYFAYNNHIIVDLTEAFGKGNEPTELSDKRLKIFIVDYKDSYNYGEKL